MSGDEQLRQQYLDAIGIVSWLPRAALPGAAPSPEWMVSGQVLTAPADDGVDHWQGSDSVDEMPRDALPIKSEAAQTTPAQSPQNPAPRPLPSALAELTEETTKRPVRPMPAEAAVSESSVDASTPVPAARIQNQEVPRFKLAFVLAGESLLVDSLPPQSKSGFSGAHQHLAAGILRALGEPESPSAAALLSWPMLASQTLDQGPEQAACAVRRKLELTLKHRPVKRALLLGDQSARWLLERSESVEQLRGLKFTLEGGVSCIVAASLTQMLHLPQEKELLWKEMQPLRIDVSSSDSAHRKQ